MKTGIRFLYLLMVITLVGCEDILEEDISGDMVQLIFPLEGAEVANNVVNFQWISLRGADSYRIQIYNSGQGIVLDSVTEGANFVYPLNSGEYQWRIKGENFAYQTEYTFPVNFSVVETDNLTNQVILLSTPQTGIYTNTINLSYSWAALSAAESYYFSVNNTANNSVAYEQGGLTESMITLNGQTAADGQYSWKVKAINETSQTAFFSRNLFLDTVVPNVPQNNAPANNASQNDNTNINFTWNMAPDSGTIQSPINFVIELSTDSSFSTIFLTSETSTTTFSHTFNTPGDYFWRVKAIDEAQNQSNYSTPYKLTITE